MEGGRDISITGRWVASCLPTNDVAAQPVSARCYW